MITIVTVITGWFVGSFLLALLLGRVMTFAKRNVSPMMPLAHLHSDEKADPRFVPTSRMKRSA
jgi:hypothetical protein